MRTDPSRPGPVIKMHHFLVLLGLLAAGTGLASLSNATLGAGLVGAACFLGIAARMAQADIQHQRLMRHMSELTGVSAVEQPDKETARNERAVRLR